MLRRKQFASLASSPRKAGIATGQRRRTEDHVTSSVQRRSRFAVIHIAPPASIPTTSAIPGLSEEPEADGRRFKEGVDIDLSDQTHTAVNSPASVVEPEADGSSWLPMHDSWWREEHTDAVGLDGLDSRLANLHIHATPDAPPPPLRIPVLPHPHPSSSSARTPLKAWSRYDPAEGRRRYNPYSYDPQSRRRTAIAAEGGTGPMQPRSAFRFELEAGRRPKLRRATF